MNDEVKTKEQLGEKLFFAPILSADNTISCAYSHKPQFTFSETATFSVGINGNLITCNSPGLIHQDWRIFPVVRLYSNLHVLYG
ncbi:cytochrome c peroxidase [[Flexibacter] sp. ATCC 35208]|uniref:cytochrome c peroxidase n=1 Tax=[Flexibacter] sp. ATCC 35208 TaxID=1936242 RepID=UPI0009D1A6DA|nr:hypothetical protein BW716_09535 [[Flexibacter] sp. ATCC 35208]